MKHDAMKIVRVKAVIFDMDGVITNTMPEHMRAWQAALKEEGVHATQEDIYSREGQRGLQSVQEIFQKYRKTCSSRSARAILKRKEEIFKTKVRLRFIRGARSFIRKLAHQGFRLAIVTGTSHHEMEKILPARLYTHFTVSVTGCEVKEGKPDPEPYLKAMKNLTLNKKEVVVIENAPFGIRSAKAAGLNCFALETSLPRRYLREADQVFSSFKEIRQKVRFENKEA